MQFPRLTKKTGKFRPGSFHQKTAAKVWNCTKDGFEEIEHEFPFLNIPSGKKGVPFQKFHSSRWNDQKCRLPLTFQPGFSETFWGDPDSFA